MHPHSIGAETIQQICTMPSIQNHPKSSLLIIHRTALGSWPVASFFIKTFPLADLCYMLSRLCGKVVLLKIHQVWFSNLVNPFLMIGVCSLTISRGQSPTRVPRNMRDYSPRENFLRLNPACLPYAAISKKGVLNSKHRSKTST